MIGLTQEQVRTFNEEGMLCIPDFLSPQEVSQMMVSAHKLLTNLELDKHPKTQFKTKENEHVGTSTFLTLQIKCLISSIRMHLTQMASSGTPRNGRSQDRSRFAHAQRCFREITFKEQIKQIARDLQYKDPRVLQRMIIFKNSTGGKDGSEKKRWDVGGRREGEQRTGA